MRMRTALAIAATAACVLTISGEASAQALRAKFSNVDSLNRFDRLF